MYRTLIVELAKIYSDKKTDKFRLNNFINLFKKEGQYGDMGIDKMIISGWENSILKNHQIIKDVLKLRDKIYAHTDPSKDDFDRIDLTFNKIGNLIKLSAGIFKDVYRIALQTDLDTTSPKFDRNRFGLIKIMVAGEKQRMEEIFRSIRNRKNIEP